MYDLFQGMTLRICTLTSAASRTLRVQYMYYVSVLSALHVGSTPTISTTDLSFGSRRMEGPWFLLQKKQARNTDIDIFSKSSILYGRSCARQLLSILPRDLCGVGRCSFYKTHETEDIGMNICRTHASRFLPAILLLLGGCVEIPERPFDGMGGSACLEDCADAIVAQADGGPPPDMGS